MGVAGLGEVPTNGPLAAGVLAWHQSAKPHELARPGEAAPVADLGGQLQRAQPGDAPVGAQAGHLLGERRPGIPAGKVGLDRVQVHITAFEHHPVVPVGGSKRGLVELLGQQPAFVRLGPRGGPAAPHPAVAQQELRAPMPRAGAVTDHVGASAAQIPYCFPGNPACRS